MTLPMIPALAALLPACKASSGCRCAAKSLAMLWRCARRGHDLEGVFIRAGGGCQCAPYDGRVVYADWLRGFGNML